MDKEQLDKWWSSLTVAQKERIASKIVSKGKGEKTEVYYPECTKVWNELPAERQVSIHDHCTDKHGLILTEWTEGETYSY